MTKQCGFQIKLPQEYADRPGYTEGFMDVANTLEVVRPVQITLVTRGLSGVMVDYRCRCDRQEWLINELKKVFKKEGWDYIKVIPITVDLSTSSDRRKKRKPIYKKK